VGVKSNSAKEVCKGIQKSVDAALLSLPPKVQANIDQVMKSLDVSPIRLQDLRALGYRILKHATEISDTLKGANVVTKKGRGRKG
jgi:hypothetical protein